MHRIHDIFLFFVYIIFLQRGAFINRDKLKAIEAQDEELAKIIYEKEKLRLKKLKQKQLQKQLSASAAREEGVSPEGLERQSSLPVQYSQPNRVHVSLVL